MSRQSASTTQQASLEDLLALEYPFNVLTDPDDGGYVVVFPDLPGCMTQVETLAELPAMAEEARRLWLEVAFEEGLEIPLPGHAPEYSGRFNVRLPKSLHRQLSQGAERDGVSLNQYVVMLLAQGHAASTPCRVGASRHATPSS